MGNTNNYLDVEKENFMYVTLTCLMLHLCLEVGVSSAYCSSICHIHLKDEDDDNRLGGLSKNHINLALHPLSTTRDTIRLAER